MLGKNRNKNLRWIGIEIFVNDDYNYSIFKEYIDMYRMYRGIIFKVVDVHCARMKGSINIEDIPSHLSELALCFK